MYAPYPIWLEGMARVVASTGIQDVRLSVDLAETSALVDEAEADLLLVDAGSQEAIPDVLAAIRQVRDARRGLRVIVVAAVDPLEVIEEIFDAGASAYVLRTADPGDLAAAIRQAFHTSIFLPSPVPAQAPAPAARAPRAAAPTPVPAPANGAAANGGAALADLTRRELEILSLAASGRSNGELARMLWVTEQTVKFHLSNIYRKLKVSNRTEAARWAQLNGLLDDEAPAAPGAEPALS